MKLSEILKDLFDGLIISPLISFIFFILLIYALPVFIFSKLADTPLPTKQDKEGNEMLDAKVTFLLATGTWLFIYFLFNGGSL